MGLDMYLMNVRNEEKIKAENFIEVGYWRKANQIHNWFVKNVQGGVDDCGYYGVTKEKLEELLSTCKKVKESIKLVDGDIAPIKMFQDGKLVDTELQLKIIENTSVAQQLLPTQLGFFFGRTDYDDGYLQDIENTIETLEEVLEETDFDTEIIVYTSSW